MISSYNITTQNVAVDGLLTFTIDRILTGCTVTRNGPTFQLNKPGYYYVTFNANGSASFKSSYIPLYKALNFFIKPPLSTVQ